MSRAKMGGGLRGFDEGQFLYQINARELRTFYLGKNDNLYLHLN